MKLTLKNKVIHQSQVNEHTFSEICDIENVKIELIACIQPVIIKVILKYVGLDF